MNISSIRLLLLIGASSVLLPEALAFDESAALPDRLLPAAQIRQRALPEDFSAIGSPAWAEEKAAPPGLAVTLLEACRGGNFEQVKRLLAEGGQPNLADASGQRPLVVAVAGGWGEIARLLLLRGADPNVKGPQGRTPLGMAAAAGHLGIVRALLQAGADIDGRSDNRATALHEAIRFDHPAVVRVLLAAKPDPLRYDGAGLHPLALAAAQGRLACLQAMLAVGMAPDLPDRTGLTALYWARHHDQPLVESLLVEHGASREAWPIVVD